MSRSEQGVAEVEGDTRFVAPLQPDVQANELKVRGKDLEITRLRYVLDEQPEAEDDETDTEEVLERGHFEGLTVDSRKPEVLTKEWVMANLEQVYIDYLKYRAVGGQQRFTSARKSGFAPSVLR